MKSVSNNIFELIHSLDKQEKRYFKIFSSRHVIGDENDYVKLFDAIAGQKIYNEKTIRKKFKNESFIKRFSALKNYLYNLILESLDIYYSEKDADRKIKKLLSYTDILKQKGLHEHSGKLLEKAKKLAYSYEKHLLLLEIFEHEKDVMEAVLNIKDFEKKIDEIYKEEQFLLELRRTLSEYSRINSMMYIASKRISVARTPDDIKNLQEIINHPLFSDEKNALTYQSKTLYYFVYIVYYSATGNLLNSYEYSKKLIETMESHPLQIKEKPYNYISALRNLIILSIHVKRYKEALQLIKKLSSYPAKTEHIKNKLFEISYSLELELHISCGEFEKGLQMIPEINNHLSNPFYNINKEAELSIYAIFSQVYFGVKDYRNSLLYLNKILNNPNSEVREDIYCYAKLLSLIVHYERGEYEYLREHYIKSAYRFLYKRKRLYEIETVFLKYIEEWTKIDSDTELIISFKEFKNELVELSKDPCKKGALDHFNLISWSESKIEKRPFAEIVKEKAKKISL